MKISGVRSVDFAIEAQGFGSVNDNYSITHTSHEGKKLNNHTVPKLRGFRWTKSDEKRCADEIDLNETPLYVSSNKIRNALFKENMLDGHFIKGDKTKTKKNKTEIVEYGNADQMLCSFAGLVRGYLCTVKDVGSFLRPSPLFVSDFTDELCNGNFEQFTRNRTQDSDDATSMFSKTTVGKTLYSGAASLRIEDLQFIVLDDKFMRAALPPSSIQHVDEICDNLRTMLTGTAEQLGLSGLNPDAEHGNYYRKGSVFNSNIEHCQYGILLNNDAVHIIAMETQRRLEELCITRAGAFMQVTRINTRWNETSRTTFTLDEEPTQTPTSTPEYAVYYEKMGA